MRHPMDQLSRCFRSTALPQRNPMTKPIVLPSLVAVALLFGLSGCNSPDSAAPVTPPPPAAETDTDHDHADHDHADHAEGAAKTDMEKMTEVLASFSPEDRESAMKQHFCPISGEMLGTMGAPEKVDVSGQSVWICCDGCKDKLLADPDKYLAKLKE